MSDVLRDLERLSRPETALKFPDLTQGQDYPIVRFEEGTYTTADKQYNSLAVFIRYNESVRKLYLPKRFESARDKILGLNEELKKGYVYALRWDGPIKKSHVVRIVRTHPPEV